ncbi:MAG: response regulator, partial [bacterium]
MEKVNILMVDDQPGKLLSYEAMLEELDENLVLARSGREALQYLLKQDFALILLDVIMPEMDGFETARLIRQHPRLEQMPIIFVTALSTSDLDRHKGYALGAVDYVFVPVVPEILRAKVSVFVELYRKRQELQSLN